MTTQLLQLVHSQLRVGEKLPFGVRNEQGQLLLAQGQRISDERQLQALIERGLYVELQEMREVQARQATQPDAVHHTLFDLWEQRVWGLERLLQGMHQEPGFAQRCASFAEALMALVQRDPDIAIYLSLRQDPRHIRLYGLSHALHTAMVCQLMATRLAWDPAQVLVLLKAALTMNLAIVELQGHFASLGKLSSAQMDQIRAHPLQAVESLRQAGVSDELWLSTVLEHHERPDGTGYPQGLQATAPLAVALRMADVFMAKISPRAARPPMPIQDAARQMFQESHGGEVAAAIIKEYGLYPPGSLVQLASGEQALVIRRGATVKTPMAAAITDARGYPVVTSIRRDTAMPAFAIVGLGSDIKLAARVSPERLYGLAR